MILTELTDQNFVVQEPGRLDQFLTAHLEGFTRSFLQRLITENQVTVNGVLVTKTGHQVKPGDQVFVSFQSLKRPEVKPFDQDIGVKIIFEHQDFIVIDKPVGLVVHKPHPMFNGHTLVDWLLASFPTLKHVGLLDRPGIVHRLDKDTSGVMIVARNNFSLSQIGQRFKDRHMHKQYLALVHGLTPEGGAIDYPVGRHNVHKHKMSHEPHAIGSRDALTHFQTVGHCGDYSLVLCKPVTGRTHQIRVHLSAIGHPLLGDVTYGGTQDLIKRHALHAYQIEFEYGGQLYQFKSELPEDMARLIALPLVKNTQY